MSGSKEAPNHSHTPDYRYRLGVCTLFSVWVLSVVRGGRHYVCTASHPRPPDSSAFGPATLTEKLYSRKNVKRSDPRAWVCSLFHEHQWRKLLEGGESKGLNADYFFFFFEELHKKSGAPLFLVSGVWGSYITWPDQAECFHSWSRPDNLLLHSGWKSVRHTHFKAHHRLAKPLKLNLETY